MTPAPHRPARRPSRLTALGGVAVLAAVTATACSTAPSGRTPAPSDGRGRTVITVVAAENFWGSIAAQLGGGHVKVTSIIDNPDADPHDYEPTAADARTVAGARFAVVNGIGYDAWADKLLAADPGRAPHRPRRRRPGRDQARRQPAPLVLPRRRAPGHRADHRRLPADRPRRRRRLRPAAGTASSRPCWRRTTSSSPGSGPSTRARRSAPRSRSSARSPTGWACGC